MGAGCPAIQQSGNPAIQQSSNPAIQQTGNPEVRQTGLPATQFDSSFSGGFVGGTWERGILFSVTRIMKWTEIDKRFNLYEPGE
jgi:hypothetical protein